MLNWFKHFFEERRLRRALHLALTDSDMQRFIKIELAKSKFLLIRHQLARFGITVPASTRLLLGKYDGDWPRLKATSAEILVELGRFIHADGTPVAILSAMVLDKRVAAFTFSRSIPHEVRYLRFEMNDHVRSSANIDIPTTFPVWLPRNQWAPAEAEMNYKLPTGYEHETVLELFRWFKIIDHEDHLFSRPTVDDKLTLSSGPALRIGEDNAGSVILLMPKPDSRIMITDGPDSTLSPFHFPFNKSVKDDAM